MKSLLFASLGWFALASCTARSGPNSPSPDSGGMDAGDSTGLDADSTIGGDLAAISDALPKLDPRLLPLEQGRVWTYEVGPHAAYPYCPSGTRTMKVEGLKMVDGRDAFEVSSDCGYSHAYYSVKADQVDFNPDGSWHRLLDEPVAEGHSWSNSRTFTWRAVGTVTVPAGTFADCWKAEQDVQIVSSWYCRGVGMVRQVVVDTAGGGYEMRLSGRNF